MSSQIMMQAGSSALAALKVSRIRPDPLAKLNFFVTRFSASRVSRSFKSFVERFSSKGISCRRRFRMMFFRFILSGHGFSVGLRGLGGLHRGEILHDFAEVLADFSGLDGQARVFGSLSEFFAGEFDVEEIANRMLDELF